MRLVFLFTTTVPTQNSHARRSSTTVRKICLSKFPQRKIQFHKEVAAQMNLGTATRPISPVEVGKYQKVMTNAFTSFPKFSQLRFSVQCTWSFFQCKKNAETCKMEHDDCLNGNICTLSNPKCNILNTFFHFS